MSEGEMVATVRRSRRRFVVFRACCQAVIGGCVVYTLVMGVLAR